MKIELLINLGSLLVAVTGAYWVLRSKIGATEKDVVYLNRELSDLKKSQSELKKVYAEIQQIKTDIAVIKERLTKDV